MHVSPLGRAGQGGASGWASTGVPELDAPSVDESFVAPLDDVVPLEEPLPVSCTDPLLVLEADVESSTAVGSSRPAMTAHAPSANADPTVASRATDLMTEA